MILDTSVTLAITFGASLRLTRDRHPAALDLDDCLSDATARFADWPLVAKSGDFRHADLPVAVPAS